MTNISRMGTICKRKSLPPEVPWAKAGEINIAGVLRRDAGRRMPAEPNRAGL
jgi:hypothetical protein